MGAALLVMLGPTVAFGLFAVLAMRFGAESRPGFDGRPVRDDRPNWPAIARASARLEEDLRRPGGGTPVVRAESRSRSARGAPGRAPVRVRPAPRGAGA
jgi:hypothetical protein